MTQELLQAAYEVWKRRATEDADLTAELAAIEGDSEAIRDRFYRELTFGTGGLRGVIGAGSNRMNIYTVRRATQGLVDYLKGRYAEAAVAVSFDSRIKSEVFAREAARVLAGNGITVHLFDELQPTPVLSYAVRELHCQAGIMVTASHNPAKYNGYKCYGSDGCQMTDRDAGEVMACIEKVGMFDGVQVADYAQAAESGRIVPIASSLVEDFLRQVETQQINPGICREVPLKVVYTPLNGTGNKPVREILRRIGVQQVRVVPEQELPDGHFPTAPYPNPEIRQAFACALKLAETEQPDLLLATDPDCDRVGIAVHEDGEYTLVSGNELGCLLLQYVLSCRRAQGTLPEKPVVVTTIVSTALVDRITAAYGFAAVRVLTGFKYIGEQIGLLEKDGEAQRYVFGFEESYGYLSGSYVRDKDAVDASMLVCEMAAYYKKQGKSLLTVLKELYATYGVYRNTLLNAEFDGADGMAAMQRLMTSLRADSPKEIAGYCVLSVADYWESRKTDCVTGKAEPLTLPQSNVLVFELEEHASVIVRPSGTEPKIKAYITATGRDEAAAEAMTARLSAAASALLK